MKLHPRPLRQIQLELNEQEASVLRRKVEDLETENERLLKEIRDVLSRTDTRAIKVGISTFITSMAQEVSCVEII